MTPANRLQLIALQIGFAAAAVAPWWLCNATGLIETSVLPAVPDVAAQFFAVIERPDFRDGLLATILDAFRGLVCATAMAVPLGVLIGMFPGLERATRVIVDFGRSFPVIALLPILVLVFGATSLMKIVAIGIACFFPILLQTIYGARRLEPTIVDTVRGYRIPGRLRFLKVLLPAAGPYIATGMRIASTVAILVSAGIEIVSLAPGIGREISLSRSYNETATAFAYIVYAGLLGVALTVLWDVLEARLLRWHLRAKAE